MDSSEVRAPQQQSSDNLVCEICDFKCDSLVSLIRHFRDLKHLDRARDLTKRLFGFRLDRRITCLDDLFKHPSRRGTFIGMHYVEEEKPTDGNWFFVCTLCDVASHTMFEHIISVKHQRNYIAKNYSFLFSDVESISPEVIEMIAGIIERVEGPRKFEVEVKNLTERSLASDRIRRRTIDKIVYRLKIYGIAFKKLGKEYHETCWATGSPPFARRDDRGSRRCTTFGAFKQPKLEQPTQPAGIAFKRPFRKENESCRATAAIPSIINVNGGKRQFKQNKGRKKGRKKRKSELPTQPAGQPIMSLARPVPVPFSFSDPYIGVPEAKNCKSYNSRQATKLPITSDIPIQDIEAKPIPSLISTHRGTSVYKTTCPPVGEYFPSCPSAELFYHTAEHGNGYSTNPSLCGFANNSAHGQATSVSDVGKEYAFEGLTWGQETGHPGAQHLHTLGTMGGPTSSVPSLKQHSTPRYGYNSVDIKDLPLKSFSPLGITSVLNKEPSLPKSHQNSPSTEGLPPATTSTGSRAQISQSTNSDMPIKAVSVLSPHTLKVLQGRDPESVKSILKRLSEYCPELQQVNISLLVDVLFETGAVH